MNMTNPIRKLAHTCIACAFTVSLAASALAQEKSASTAKRFSSQITDVNSDRQIDSADLGIMLLGLDGATTGNTPVVGANPYAALTSTGVQGFFARNYVLTESGEPANAQNAFYSVMDVYVQWGSAAGTGTAGERLVNFYGQATTDTATHGVSKISKYQNNLGLPFQHSNSSWLPAAGANGGTGNNTWDSFLTIGCRTQGAGNSNNVTADNYFLNPNSNVGSIQGGSNQANIYAGAGIFQATPLNAGFETNASANSDHAILIGRFTLKVSDIINKGGTATMTLWGNFSGKSLSQNGGSTMYTIGSANLKSDAQTLYTSSGNTWTFNPTFAGTTPYQTPWTFNTGAVDTLAAPTGVVASDGTDVTGVLISWNASTGATGYAIFRDDIFIGSSAGATTSYLDTTVSLETIYTYKVQAIDGANVSTVSAGDTGFRSIFIPDTDNDGIADNVDNCPNIANPNQADCNGDGVGDVCAIANGAAQDCNLNSIPDSCETDTDADGIIDACDTCPSVAGPCNGCPTNACGGCGAALDTDGDGTPDCIDDDDDNDGVVDSMDAFPLDASESVDTDHDGIGNNVDTDDDGDGFDDATDLCPLDANKSKPGQCGCGVPDTDTDGDGVVDCLDNCVLISNPNQSDCNGDGVGDMCEIANGAAQDCNANGIPDNCDLLSGVLKDLNGNGYPDSCELAGPTGGVTAWGNNQSVQCNVPASANNFSTIATGSFHTIALKDGAVLAWGSNWDGQCNIPAEAQSGVTAIAGGGYHSLALKNNGVLAWGNNNYGQCNIPAEAQSSVTAIAGGYLHTIALKIQGSVLAWGDNASGKCNIPPSAQSGVTAIACGAGHSIALKDGAVLAWGNNDQGQCTIPDSAKSGVTAIACGWAYTIALKDGAVLAWGENWIGQCDIPAEAQSGVTAIAGGQYHTIALKGGAVLAWGANWNGELNIPVEAQSGVTAIAGASGYTVALKDDQIFGWGQNVPAFPTSSATSDVVSVAGGYSHTIALKIQGSVLAWGDNSSGQCNIPAAAQNGVIAIAGGYFHTIALKDGAVLAWGENWNGQCTIPAEAQSGITAIAGGYYHTIALKAGSVLAWGNNEFGQCTIPADALSGVSAIAGGARHTIALKVGAVRAWGYNGDGQCNIPATALSEVSAIAGGYGHTIALKNDGSVIAWGRNYDGECLGTDAFGNPNTASTRGQPVRIMGVTLSGITAIAGGGATTDMGVIYGFTMALKSDGSVVAWGSNIRGQCNISETLGFCTAIAAGTGHAIAIQIDCDGNGVADATQTIANPDLDQNHNYQLDSCEIGTGTEEDCNHNGVLDLVEQGLNTPVALASQKLSPIGYGQDASGNTNSKTWTIATPANAISDPVLEIKAFGDFSLTTEYLTVFMNNRFIGNYFKYPAKDCSEISQTLTIPLEIFNSIIAGSDGSTADLVIDFMPSIAVDAHACNNGSWIKGSLSYTSAVGADCNANGLLDECETRDYPETDFNHNGIVDECESGGSIGSCPGDLDHNRVLDSGDVSMVLLNIGIITMPGDPLDLDNNGVVDSGDVSWILLNTGDCP